MSRLALLHMKPAEAAPRVAALQSLGHDVYLFPEVTPKALRVVRVNPPEALIIDLTRLPALAREIGVSLRASPKTRHMPLIFAGGEPDKVARVRELLPDATYAEWDEIEGAIRRAVTYMVHAPVVPPHGIENPDKPVVEKLGIKEGMRVALVDAPDEIDAILAPLPDGVTLANRISSADSLRLWFVSRRADFERRLPSLGKLPPKCALWICSPKKASGLYADLSQNLMREVCIAIGLVDNKICAMSDVWTGMRFAVRKAAKSR